MSADPSGETRSWTIEQAEALLNSLTGVVSARLVGRPGSIDEIHLLTTKDVSPKQCVRNVESALLAHLDLEIDHRKVSVAQTSDASGEDDGDTKVLRHPARRMEDRILFVAHQVETERAHHAKIRVSVELRGTRYEGHSTGADLSRARNETAASATLNAVEAAVDDAVGEGAISLSLDGVKLVEAFDQTFVLVAIHAMQGRAITALAGAAAIDETSDRAVILATLQAVDRWVRGRI